MLVGVFDSDGCLQFANQSFLTTFQLDESARGQVMQRIMPFVGNRFFEKWQEALKGTFYGRIESQWILPGGKPLWHAWELCPLGDENSAQGLLFLSHIYPELASEAIHDRQMEHHFQSFMAYSPMLAWIKDEDFRIRYLNPPYEKILGKSLSQVFGKTEEEIPLASLAAEERRANDLFILETRKSIVTEEYVPSKDGSWRHVLSHKFPVEYEPGKLGVGGLAIDISARVIAEERLAEANAHLAKVAENNQEKADRAMEELNNFAYSMAHDLRAPIRHISGYAHFLSELDEVLSPDQRVYVANIQRAAQKMATMVDELVVFARTQKQEIFLEPLDLSAMVQEQILVLDSPPSHIDWKVAPLPIVKGDRKLIMQVLQNILENAIKFTSKKSVPQIVVEAEEEEEVLKILIRDNGAGFDPNKKESLFRLFQRLHHEEDFPGTGIGLAKVRAILQNHGGAIDAEGELDKGACFTISLPRR